MLLLDNNLSPKLCRRLEPVFPGNQHVENVGLDNSPDSEVWKYAKANQLAILTKDSDFNHMALLFGPPPKVIWLRCGNVTSAYIFLLLSSRQADISDFLSDPAAGLLEIY